MSVKPYGVVLAGGQSSRMGEEKSLTMLAGEPMLVHVIKRLIPQVQQVFLSCEPADKSLAKFGCQLIEDEVPRHRGPLAGLYSALLYMQRKRLDSGLLLCPCDAPFIPSSLVEKLQLAVDSAPGCAGVVSYEGFLQPTFSLWGRQHLPVIKEAVMKRGQGGLKRLITTIPHIIVDWPASEPPPFYNINTPEQLDVARQWLTRLN